MAQVCGFPSPNYIIIIFTGDCQIDVDIGQSMHFLSFRGTFCGNKYIALSKLWSMIDAFILKQINFISVQICMVLND